MGFETTNPLGLLFQGPLDLVDLASLGVNLKPDCPLSEMMDVLNNLANQYLEDPQKILIPHWWKDTPEKFREKIIEDYLSMWLIGRELTAEEKQRVVMETYVNMWSEFLGSAD